MFDTAECKQESRSRYRRDDRVCCDRRSQRDPYPYERFKKQLDHSGILPEGKVVIDVINEELITLHNACDLSVFRNAKGKPIHVSQLYRYVLNGTRTAGGSRVKLEVVKTPGGLRTSREAIQRFVERLTAGDPRFESAPRFARTSARRDRNLSRVERELEQAGI